MSPRYQVLSLDLHDTMVWDTRAIVEAQYEVRLGLLSRGLRTENETPVPLERLREAQASLHSRWESEGRFVESVPIAVQIDELRRRLGARYAGPIEQVVQDYATGGLKEHPPVLNPEALALVRPLNEARFPVIVITDTSRSGRAWKAFLEDSGGLQLADVIASTDVGACKPDSRIFAEAARRAGVAPSEVLHVGDSWKGDVEGARRCGMGAALYRGLWSHHWDPGSKGEVPPADEASVPCLDRLSEVNPLLGLP